MKSLTPTASAQCRSRYNEPVLLLEIDWSDTEVGRYADRSVSIGGDDYLGIIKRVGPIACSFAAPASEFAPLDISLFPEDSLRQKLTEASPEGKSARVKLFFAGTEAADAIELFSGHLGSLTVSGADPVELRLAGFFRKYNRMLPGDVILPTDFPKAEAEDVGKPMPIVFGDVPGLPTLRARTGSKTHLYGSILSSDTTIEVEDTSGFPTSGSLLIEEEQVTYTGIGGDVFTGCTRGAAGTDAVDHLNRRGVIEYMTEHIYLVAGHACKAVDNVRVGGVHVEQGACTIDLNNTGLISGKSLATITFDNRPKVRRYSRASRFLEMQFDAAATGNEATNPSYCYDTTLEGFATLASEISGAANNDTLRIEQTTDVSGYGEKYGEILKAFLMVEHFESETFDDDYLSAHVAGQSYNLAKPSDEDTAGGGGDVDIDHGHTHSITGEHTHTMTVKKEPVFTSNVVQIGGTTGLWSELNDIAGSNLNRSGFTTSPSTDRSLQCTVAATTSKGNVEKIQFCCRRGESGMTGSFYLRFYLNGSLEKTYQVSGTSSPQTWKSGWETISGLDWDDLEASNTYILITPVSGNSQNIRLFGTWYELEYVEQPDTYEGSGTKGSSDVNDHSGNNVAVINQEPISSTSVVEGVDITALVANDWTWFNDREVRVDYNVTNSDDGVTGYILHVWFEIEFAPYEEIISDEVTCDVQGVETDGDGTGDLVDNPADVFESVLVNLLGLDKNTYIDAASFSSARQSLDSEGVQFAFSLRKPGAVSDLLHSLAEQARCRLKFDSGKFQLIYRPDSLGQPAKEIVSDDLRLGSTGIRHAGPDTAVNRIVGYHSRDYRSLGATEDRYSDIVISDDSQSQTEYGLQERRLELFALRDGSYAQDLVDFFVARGAEPARRYSWRSFLRDADLERGDIVEVADLDLDLLKVKAEITSSTFIPGDGTRKELDSIAFEAELEPFSFFWSVSGGAYIRLVDGSFFFVVNHELVARLSSDGIFYIKGFVVGDQSLSAASANPVSYDATREAIAFALNDNTRVMEIDNAGNILLPIQQETDQGPLAFSGSADEIDSDASEVWFNIGSVRAAEISSAGLLILPKYIVENCNWEILYAT